MRLFLYVLAIFIPPLVPLLLGYGLKHTAWNVVLTSLFWIPGVIHATILVWGYKEYDNSPEFNYYIGYDIND